MIVRQEHVMRDLSGYAFSLLRQGELALYRGCGDGLEAILLVTPTRELLSVPSIQRLEHEFVLRGELDPSWAARPVFLTRRDDRVALVLEDPGGHLLERLLGQPLDVAQFLRIAIPLATSLRQVHERGLIHKDIKPGNVLVDLARDRIWLIGFGIASRLPSEHQLPEPAEVISGTLAYMAPEQTGRMNRSTDSRSDLYALGVTFYEMLVGALPFAVEDPLEWVHCHIARKPVPPNERVLTVPAQLSAIVMKLLSKTAEERYQTAAGVESDLRRCLSEWEELGRVDEFPPGANDRSDRLLIPEKLYGRAREVDCLLASFDRVVRDATPQFVLVSGYSGIGKTSIVNELHKVLVTPRALFASGKFDQYKRDIPYVTLAQAFQSLVRPLLGKSQAELETWRDAFCRALDPNGQLIVNLVPELKRIIGEQPPIPDLPPQDAQRRFQLVFRRFLSVFARPQHPLALFLDDLQWCDAATLNLVADLLTQPDVRHLLLIGAYRDNEVDPTHPLIRKLAAICEAGVRIHRIIVAALERDDLEQLVVDTVHCETEQAAPLAELLKEKTAGNPFFVFQFLRGLVEEGLLVFDRDVATWTWDLARIRARGFTDNIVDLMVDKLTRLPAATQDAMTHLACLGNHVAAETLSMIQGMNDVEIMVVLWDPLRMGLIFRSESGFAFLHDRVQEAAYALLPPGDRAATHLRIGRLLAARIPADKMGESVFDIANQLNRGADLITSVEERQRVAELNLIAGKSAKGAAAFPSALNYFVAGDAMLSDDRWERQYYLAFELALHRCETEFFTGDSESAEARLAALARRAANLVDLAAVTRLRLTVYLALDRFDTAIEVGLQYLGQAGIAWPAHPTDGQMTEEFDQLWSRLGERSIEDLVNLPVMDDRTSRATIDVLTALAPAATYTDIKLVGLIIGRMVRLSLEKGICDGTCYAYVTIGRVLGPRFGDYRSGYRFAQIGLDLVDVSDHRRFEVREYIRGRIYFAYGALAVPWAKHICTAVPFLRRAFEVSNKIGDLTFAAYSCNNLYTLLLAAGVPLAEIQREARDGLEFARQAGIGASVNATSTQLAFLRMLQGKTAHVGSLNDSEFDEDWSQKHFDQEPNASIVTCWYWIYKLQALFFADRYLAAIEAASRAERLLWANATFFPVADFHFYGALSRASHHDAATPEQQKLDRDALAAHKRQIDAWAEACRENFGDRAALVAAEVARIEGHDLEAMRYYEDAIKLAREHGFIQNEGIACEIAAKFYAGRGFTTIFHTYLRNARSCYLRWGALGKVQQLDQRYPHLREETFHGAVPAAISPVGNLDVDTVVKASHALSREIVLGKLIETLMTISIEHAGAERGLLVLISCGDPQIEAEASTSGDVVQVTRRETFAAAPAFAKSILHYVIRMRQSVVLDDASAQNVFSDDEYVRARRARSIMCLPIIKQGDLIGAVYLENNLADHAFTQERLAVLEVLASQAAISLENARLYADLQRENSERQRSEAALRASEERWRTIFESTTLGIAMIDETLRYTAANSAFKVLLGYGDDELAQLTPLDISVEEGRELTRTRLMSLRRKELRHLDIEEQYRCKDGSLIWVHNYASLVLDQGDKSLIIGIIIDITQSKRTHDALRDAQSELARVSRLTTMGEMTASIAHEINQPLAAIVAGGNAGLRWLRRTPPHIGEVQQSLKRIVSDADRASQTIAGIRGMFMKGEHSRTLLDVNGLISEVLGLLRGELNSKRVVVRTELAKTLPKLSGDQVQLQQVVLNLVMNAGEAMSSMPEGARTLTIRSQVRAPDEVVIAVEDSGPGIDAKHIDRVFDPFFTTKPSGMGMGLSICRSIIEAHQGRLSASPGLAHGAVFEVALPTNGAGRS